MCVDDRSSGEPSCVEAVSMECLLARFSEPDADIETLFVHLIDLVRPARPSDAASARNALESIRRILESCPEIRAGLRKAFLHIPEVRRHTMLYTTSGILPNTGFFNEVLRRLCDKFLPDALDPNYLKSFFQRVFYRSSDCLWVADVGENVWLDLVGALHFEEEKNTSDELPHGVSEILRSLRILAYWIAALGMDPELFHVDPDLGVHESPFAAQSSELDAYIAAYMLFWKHPGIPGMDDKQLHMLLGQCNEVIIRIRHRAARNGTSIRLTYHLRLLDQLIQRCEDLLHVAENLRTDPEGWSARPPLVRLFILLVCEECRRNDLLTYWRQNTELIALRITENASDHGEHYIATKPREYLGMFQSALVGGVIIAFMAALKLLIGTMTLPPLVMALVLSLNYGVGFCLIHILHGVVATKQPAMTANAIAACIESSGKKLSHIDGKVTRLVANAFQTQIVAIFGNVLLATLLSWLLAYLFFQVSGRHFISADKAAYLLQSQSVIQSGTVFYAAIAGVWLFVSGLISGFFDNYVAYNRIVERIARIPWIRRQWGAYRAQRFAAYMGQHFGALSGNFLFGFLLGSTALLGFLTGLPIDIRHVAFSSAYVGFSAVSLGLGPGEGAFLWAMLDMASIGFFNLIVSFSLAFHVALRSRQIEHVSLRQLVGAYLGFLRKYPARFFPPRH